MTEIATAPAAPATRTARWIALPVVLFALVSLTAGLLAAHEPRSKGYFRLFFSDSVHLKAGFATAAAVRACFQVFSLFGCAVYGGYAAKVTIVRLHRFPRFVPAYSVAPIPAGADAAVGARVLAKAGCGGCHALKAAGSSGSVGPNLDSLQPSFPQVKAQVENGGGVMPAFRGTLTPKEIRDVAAFVASTAASGP